MVDTETVIFLYTVERTTSLWHSGR